MSEVSKNADAACIDLVEFFLIRQAVCLVQIPEDEVLLPERLRELGYETRAR